MLAAGGAVGAASEASAATIITQDFNFAGTDAPQAVVLGDGPAQFFYGFSLGQSKFDTGSFLTATSFGVLGLTSDTAGLPTAGETFTSKQVKTSFSISGPLSAPSIGGAGPDLSTETGNDLFVHLAFKSDGVLYVGTADVGGDTTLESITYETAKDGGFGNIAVPEPDVWAMMIAGLGLSGAALRQRRGQLALSA
jgi:hypothetical protein